MHIKESEPVGLTVSLPIKKIKVEQYELSQLMILQLFFEYKNLKKFFVSSQIALLKKPFPKWKKVALKKK